MNAKTGSWKKRRKNICIGMPILLSLPFRKTMLTDRQSAKPEIERFTIPRVAKCKHNNPRVVSSLPKVGNNNIQT